VNSNSPSRKSGLPWIFLLAALATLSAVFVWRGAEKAKNMQPEAANHSRFAQLRPQETAKVVIEVLETSEGMIRGRLLDKQNDTHYTRSQDQLNILWNSGTAIVMGKAADLHAGAIIHVTGTVAADHSLEARQIVILTGYVQVK